MLPSGSNAGSLSMQEEEGLLHIGELSKHGGLDFIEVKQAASAHRSDMTEFRASRSPAEATNTSLSCEMTTTKSAQARQGIRSRERLCSPASHHKRRL